MSRARRVRASCRGAASMRRLGLLSGSPCDSRIQLFAAPSTGDAASVSSRLEPVENDHRADDERSEEHTSELQSLAYLVCRLLLEKKKMPILGTISGKTVKLMILPLVCLGNKRQA